MSTLKIIRVQGDPTVAHIESNELECVKCGKLYDRRAQKHAGLRVGSPCDACGGKLDVRFHLVDVSKFFPVGECQCENWQMNPKLGKVVRRMSPAKLAALTFLEQEELRCSHLKAFRNLLLNDTVRGHMRQRGDDSAREERAA